MHPPTVPAALLLGPFTTRQGAAAGVTRHMLRSPVWRQVIRGVWVHADIPDSRELRAAAAKLLLDPAVFLCGVSAAWLYAVDLHPLGETVPSLWVGCHNGRRARARPGWRVREITVDPAELRLVEGVRVTSPLRTCFDCARWLPLVEAVVVLDALAHAKLVRLAEVASYAEGQYRIRGKRRVARVVELADARAESPQESRLRVHAVLAGLRPEPQHEVRDGGGRFVARVDLAFEEAKLALEYQGRHHEAIGPEDERRRAALRRQGWEIVYVYASDLATEGARRALFARVHAELARRTAPPPPPPSPPSR